jgi:hypothetical protein
VIHLYALDPKLVAQWGTPDAFRYIAECFGLGKPRAMLELPWFEDWWQQVMKALAELDVPDLDRTRVAALAARLKEHKLARKGWRYASARSWLENAEQEHDRKPFKAILAVENPRKHPAVVVGMDLDVNDPRWACPPGASFSRTAEAIANVLSAMLINCRRLHLVDPNFGAEERRYRDVLVALMDVLAVNDVRPDEVCLHCSDKASLEFFKEAISKMHSQLPAGIAIKVVRWKREGGTDQVHNRYVLTDLGGVFLGTGIDRSDKTRPNETDDLSLLTPEQYRRRWAQYVDKDGTLEVAEELDPIRGTRGRAEPAARGHRDGHVRAHRKRR